MHVFPSPLEQLSMNTFRRKVFHLLVNLWPFWYYTIFCFLHISFSKLTCFRFIFHETRNLSPACVMKSSSTNQECWLTLVHMYLGVCFLERITNTWLDIHYKEKPVSICEKSHAAPSSEMADRESNMWQSERGQVVTILPRGGHVRSVTAAGLSGVNDLHFPPTCVNWHDDFGPIGDVLHT